MKKVRTSGLFILTMVTLYAAAGSAGRPNILIIICDDLQIASTDPRFQNQMSINYFNPDNDRPYTPHIDSLAGAGLEFTRSYASSTVCAPARYTVLTGRYAGHNKSRYYLESRDDNQLAGEETFLSRIENTNIAMEKGNETHAGMNVQTRLSEAGYLTGITGKWHLGEHVANTSQAWQDFGWERYATDADPATDETVNQRMRANQLVLQEHLKTYGWDWAGNVYIANTLELRNDKLNVHNIEWTVKGAFEFLDLAVQDTGRPFFLYFSPTLQHGPDPWANDQASSTKADIRYTGDGFYTEGVKYKGENVMPTRQQIIDKVKAAGKNEADAWTALLDEGVGALLDKIEELNMSENTMVFFTSDHGYDRYGKASLLEGGVRVPLFITWKNKIPPGKKIDQLVQNIDYAPTFYHYAGILDSLPDAYLMNGRSLHPYIENPDAGVVLHDALYCEVGFARSVITLDNKYIAIRYPNKINQQIEEGYTWEPFISGDPPLTQPYLLANKHLGHWSSTYNTQYFNVDQYYDFPDDPEDYQNLLYVDNETPIPDEELDPDVKAGRDSLQQFLSIFLNQFEGAYFGEFYDGVQVKVEKKGNGVTGEDYGVRYDGREFQFPDNSVTELRIFDTRGSHLRSIHVGGRRSVPWDGRSRHGKAAAQGVYLVQAVGIDKKTVLQVIP